MEIRKGFVYRKWNHCRRLVGRVAGPIYEKDIDNHDWNANKMYPSLATHIMQIFIVTSDGTVSIPLGFVPTTAISGDALHQLVRRVVTIFSENGDRELIWGSTNGFATNHTFMKLMSKETFVWHHFLIMCM
eukprot:Pompholyxophrys_punicea_v1_NODE_87_length_3649_cov_61.360879.p1 type:complete len:131 gc:universal NODE_87_length_3649_cov_61.360879:575-183(-)